MTAFVLGGCALLGPPHTITDSAAVTEAVTAIEIDQPDGAVVVQADDDATEISIERTVHYRGPEREIGETHAVEGGTLVLGGCGRNCSVDYVLEVPAGLDVSGETTNGSIELSGVAEVAVSTSNGRIELDGVTGSVDADTSNGRIIGTDLTGDGVEASTSNGAIELELGTPQDVTADTSNGSIELRVPDARYRVETETSNGGIDVGIDDLADGEFTLDLRTSNGSITVSPVR
ncbi:DUF4097 family beta strand repeat protein [Agromyces sp. CFH 90414]|uniref:DUF4097 family beta strand repeat protein n=2 Tax=Agromyces agglutinans TaxID=2662258 RepID=A0A6I2FBD6_9MICO|nr:DUF4097 family beta strand repeat protein [Agromyces agglutinans]